MKYPGYLYSRYLLCGEDQEEGGVDLDENIEIWLGEEGWHLTDDEEHHGRQEGRHHGAGQRSAQRDLHHYSVMSRYELVTEVDVFKEILKEFRGSWVLNGLSSKYRTEKTKLEILVFPLFIGVPPKGDFRLGHVVEKRTYLRRVDC